MKDGQDKTTDESLPSEALLCNCGRTDGTHAPDCAAVLVIEDEQ